MIPLKRRSVNYNYLPAGETSRKSGKINFVTSGVLYYFNSQHLMYELSKDARAFYDFLCERMDDENNVTISHTLKMSFVEHFSRLTSNRKNIAEGSLPSYVSKLNNLGLIIAKGKKGSAFYCVNPKYAFKGTKKNRVDLIRKLINTRGTRGLSLYGLLDTPESEL